MKPSLPSNFPRRNQLLRSARLNPRGELTVEQPRLLPLSTSRAITATFVLKSSVSFSWRAFSS